MSLEKGLGIALDKSLSFDNVSQENGVVRLKSEETNFPFWCLKWKKEVKKLLPVVESYDAMTIEEEKWRQTSKVAPKDMSLQKNGEENRTSWSYENYSLNTLIKIR